MSQNECVKKNTKSNPAGLAESLCRLPSPRNFQNLIFYFQILVFFFKILVSSVGESGSRGFFLCQISKCGFLFSKFGFLRSGIWEFGATETMILFYFSISASVGDTEKISRPCIRRHPKSDTEEVIPAGLPSSMR